MSVTAETVSVVRENFVGTLETVRNREVSVPRGSSVRYPYTNTPTRQNSGETFNPLSPNSDQHQFSPNNIHRLSSATSMIFYQFLPTNSVRKSIEISLEDLFVDIGA